MLFWSPGSFSSSGFLLVVVCCCWCCSRCYCCSCYWFFSCYCCCCLLVAVAVSLLLVSLFSMLSGSNPAPLTCVVLLLLRYTVSHFSPYIFAASHENRATPLKVSQKGPVAPVWGGGVAPQHFFCTTKLCVPVQGVSQLQCRESRYTAPLSFNVALVISRFCCFCFICRLLAFLCLLCFFRFGVVLYLCCGVCLFHNI